MPATEAAAAAAAGQPPNTNCSRCNQPPSPYPRRARRPGILRHAARRRPLVADALLEVVVRPLQIELELRRLVLVQLGVRRHRPEPPLPLLHLGLCMGRAGQGQGRLIAAQVRRMGERRVWVCGWRWSGGRRGRCPCLSLEVRRELRLRYGVEAREDELEEVVELADVPLGERVRGWVQYSVALARHGKRATWQLVSLVASALTTLS